MTPVAMQFVHEFSCLIYQIGAQCMNSISRDAQQASYCSHFEVYLVYSIYIHIHTHIYIYVCMYAYIHIYVCKCQCMYMYTRTRICICVCLCVCVCLCTCTCGYIYERAAFRVYLALAFPCNTGSYFKYFK